MKIRNTHDVVIDIHCDWCKMPLYKNKKGYWLGYQVIDLVTLTEDQLCQHCYHEYVPIGNKNESC